MGTITRFPYVAMRNGGGAFLVPFVICMIVAAGPLFYLETIVGQFSGKSPLALWGSISPAFKGLGVSVTIMSGICSITNMNMQWSIFYLIQSFSVVLPWQGCDNQWNTDKCSNAPMNATNATTNKTATPAEEFWK